MQKVIIVQRILPHYRVGFFDRLAASLRERGARLYVVHGQEAPGSVPRTVTVERPWAVRVENRYLLGGRVVSQPWVPMLAESDLLIAEHANSLLLNHRFFWSRRASGSVRFAFWGHGYNHLRRFSSGREDYKRRMAQRADWWFVYTDSGLTALTAAGFPRDRVTVVNNSADTCEIADARARVSPDTQAELRARLGIRTANVGIFCGGMYAEKRLRFLVEASELVRAALPDFELLAVGDGPDRYIIESAAARHRWIHYVGPKFGAALRPYLSLARLFLMPGLVGLAVIDSFAAGVPLITTRLRIHSPEFNYMQSGVNGLVSEDSVADYARTVIGASRDSALLASLQAGCRESSARYSLAAMTDHYVDGIERCLSAAPAHASSAERTRRAAVAPLPNAEAGCAAAMRVVVVTNILTPYRIPLFKAIRARVQDFHVLLMASREENRAWDLEPASFCHEVLPGLHVHLPGGERSRHFNYGTQRALRRLRPDVVLSGGFAPANLAAWWHCRRHGIPYVGWGELSSHDRHASAAGRLVRRLLIMQAEGAVASSSEAAAVFGSYGMPSSAILTSLMPVDVRFYHERAQLLRNSGQIAALRSSYQSPLLISIGRLAERKGYREFFAIYAELLKHEPMATVLILGDGPERKDYEAYVRSRGWDNVHFLGFRQRGEVAELLALADVFVFHTLHDPWGAVLSEAMACEVPVVSSIFAAATRDLVQEGVTGFRIDPRDPSASAHAVLKVLRLSAADRALITNRAYARVAAHDIATAADELVAFLARVWRAGRTGGVPRAV